jgi:beta-glucosidase
MRAAVSSSARVVYDSDGRFEQLSDKLAEVGIVVLAEIPYAEGFGDQPDPSLSKVDILLIERMRALCQKLVVILLSGRPLIITEQLPDIDALVAAWLPGTEGQGVADVLFGDLPFSGRLSFSWPRSMDQIPIVSPALGGRETDALFPIGFGL